MAHLRSIRLEEARTVISLLPVGGSMLEVGCGAGWQSEAFSKAGFDVTALDVDLVAYAFFQEALVWPRILFNGQDIPFGDASFDVVFTSNTLPHVDNVDVLLCEMRRVLRPGGLAVNVLPTSSWRLWTIICHFFSPRLYKSGWEQLRECLATKTSNNAPKILRDVDKKPSGRNLVRKLFPQRLGNKGTVIGEVYEFSESKWAGFFAKAGFSTLRIAPAGVFYTGHSVMGSRLSVNTRAKIARWLGSSCKIYICNKIGGHE